MPHSRTSGLRLAGATEYSMRDLPTIIEDLLRHPLRFSWYTVANAPVRYRAIEHGDIRFAWTVPPYLRPVAAVSTMIPAHYALVLQLSTMGDWRIVELKPFEWAEHAERWARGLWHDARRRGERAGGSQGSD